MQSVDISDSAGDAVPLPMNGAWRTIRSYIFWQHERGTLHYDIMVTLILIFIFFSPRVITFNDKPGVENWHPTGVVVTSDGSGLIYEIDAAAVTAVGDTAIREQLTQIIAPISGQVSIEKYDRVNEGTRVREYRVWVKRK